MDAAAGLGDENAARLLRTMHAHLGIYKLKRACSLTASGKARSRPTQELGTVKTTPEILQSSYRHSNVDLRRVAHSLAVEG